MSSGLPQPCASHHFTGRGSPVHANGPEGLVKAKKAFIVQASGGIYLENPAKAANFWDTYLKHILSFIGITEKALTAAGMSQHRADLPDV